MLTRLLLIAALCLFPACAGAQSANGASVNTGPLAPGDVIRIAVWRNPELSGDFVVGTDGTIMHPLYREISTIGVPLRDLDARFQEFLKRYDANPTFVLTALLRIYVGGEVRLPNSYIVPPGTTFAQAVLLAGGPTERANINDVRLVRGNQVRRLSGSITNSEAISTQLRSGDQVVVTRDRALLREYVGPIASFVAAMATLINLANK